MIEEEPIDIRYSKKVSSVKITECSCGAKHILERNRMSYTCTKCGKEHALFFKVIDQKTMK